MGKLLVALLLLAVGCKKNEINALPPATQEGRNTLGFLLDGKAWVPDGGGAFTGIKPVDGGYEFNYVDSLRNNVWINTVRKDGSGLDIYLRAVKSTGIYQLNRKTQVAPTVLIPQNYAYYYDKNGNYLTDEKYTGAVTITRADTVGKTVSGFFVFTAHDHASGKTITITEGRFDVKYKR